MVPPAKTMNDDDELCLCFHVKKRKVIQFIRTQQPRRASELSECFGAGTGCGWCRPYLEKLLKDQHAELPDSHQYALQRGEYRERG